MLLGACWECILCRPEGDFLVEMTDDMLTVPLEIPCSDAGGIGGEVCVCVLVLVLVL